MAVIINSTTNPLIKLAKALRQKKARDDNGLFLVEGILHVGEAFEAAWEFEVLIFCPDRLISEFGLALVEAAEERNIKCVQVSEAVFESISEKDNPQGIAAIIHQKKRNLFDVSNFNLIVAIISPQDPGNVGTILRTIDAVGGDALFLIDGGVDPYHSSSVRASMGTIFWKPFYSINFTEFLMWSKEQGVRIIGTSAHAPVDYRKIRIDHRPTILFLGSEQKGLLPEQLQICTDLVYLPMRGRATSLNLAVAAGIFLYSIKE